MVVVAVVVVSGRGVGVTSIPLPSVKEKSSCGMNTLVYSFGPSIFSPVGLWLLERRCRLAPSQKESIFLPLLHFSLSASFSLIQYFIQNTTLSPPCTGKECWKALAGKQNTRERHAALRTRREECESTVPTRIP